eukprot:5297747-Lingulodinium_polyedra.AAC.1
MSAPQRAFSAVPRPFLPRSGSSCCLPRFRLRSARPRLEPRIPRRRSLFLEPRRSEPVYAGT